MTASPLKTRSPRQAAMPATRRGLPPIDMNNRTLLTTGAIGSVIAAVCFATPIPAIAFAALGLTAWLSKADYVVIPALLICLGLVGVGLYRRHVEAQACCDPAAPKRSEPRPQ